MDQPSVSGGQNEASNDASLMEGYGADDYVPSGFYNEYERQVPPYNMNNQPIYEWRDITKDFFTSVKDLELGELMHHEMFGLFEAMSAIEMMDPKMDAGMCCNKDNVPPLNLTTAIESGQIKMNNLEPNELIGIMDGIFSCIVTWLDGHSSAQTIFTCLYLEKPYSIEDKSLRAFCFATYKLAQSMCTFITNAAVFEEEDFQPRFYGYVLYPCMTEVKACGILKEAEDELIKKLKEDDKQNEHLNAIISRLKFMRFLLQSLIAIPSKAITVAEIEAALRLLNGALEMIPTIKNTISLGTQADPNSDAPNPMGFSPLVNQRLLPPTFPRYTKIKDRSTSILFLEGLVQRLKLACKIIHCTTFYGALNFFDDFSKKAGPCLLSRSVLQLLYRNYQGKIFGTVPVQDMLKESAKSFTAPPAITSKILMNNEQVKACVDAFFLSCENSTTFIRFINICGYNRARQRDKLAHLLDDFVNLQDEADRVDCYLHQLSARSDQSQLQRQHFACFGTWIMYNCLRAMEMYILSGLELELYSVHEYVYIFWYLSEYLFNWISLALTRAEQSLKEYESLQSEQQQGKSQGKQKKTKQKRKKSSLYEHEVILNQAMRLMSLGYFRAILAFTKESRIPQPLSIFDNERVRFDHRFAPFFCHPALLVTYKDFDKKRNLLLMKSASELYMEASEIFHQARGILEASSADPEVTDLLRIAKVNFVVLNLLAKGHKRNSTSPPEFDFAFHRYFPIIKQ